MKGRSASKIKLTSYDELLGGGEETNDIQQVSLEHLHSFENHPFQVNDDEAMAELVESVKEEGILTALLVRPLGDGEYEIIAGHRRRHAAQLAGLKEVPVIIRNMDQDTAVRAMVDSNLQRPNILPSEKAFAYRMKMEAMNHQGTSGGISAKDIGRLPVHVRVIADEFANIGQIPQFDKLIATIRSREISASIILQSQSQLKAMYKDSADTILGNCDTTLFLGGKEKTTLKEMSELLGKETIDLYNTSETRSNQKSFGLNYQKTGKQLMTEDEIAVMDGGKCILQIRGARPFFSDKYDITKHKNYRLLADENEKNRYKVEKELNPQYTPKSEEEVEVIHVELSE